MDASLLALVPVAAGGDAFESVALWRPATGRGVFGGQTASPGTPATATDDIQVVDPATHHSSVVAHLPQALYGAAAFKLAGTLYVAGGQVPSGPTLTTIDAYVPTSHKVLAAGLLPQAEAFGGYTTVGSGSTAVGYIAGGEVAAQSGPDQAGIASGTLQTVLSLRPSTWGGAAGSPGAKRPVALAPADTTGLTTTSPLAPARAAATWPSSSHTVVGITGTPAAASSVR